LVSCWRLAALFSARVQQSGWIDRFITAQIVIQRLNEVIDATEDEKTKKPWVEIETCG